MRATAQQCLHPLIKALQTQSSAYQLELWLAVPVRNFLMPEAHSSLLPSTFAWTLLYIEPMTWTHLLGGLARGCAGEGTHSHNILRLRV